jgi:Flp pilus assembly protein TadG
MRQSTGRPARSSDVLAHAKVFGRSCRNRAYPLTVISVDPTNLVAPSSPATLPDEASIEMPNHDDTTLPASSRERRGLFGPLRSDAGSISLEFAILLPFLIMVFVGTMDGSLLFYDKAVITDAARAAARAGIVLRAPPLSTSQIATIAQTSAQTNLVTNGSTTVPTVAVSQPSGTTSGSPLRVTVSYTYQGLMLGSAFSAVTGPIVLNATAVMNYE